MDQREARDEAIERVSSAEGNEWWKPYAMKAVYEAACLKREITSDDVWRILHQRNIRDPKENRVMGPVMIEAQKEGWIVQTDRTRISDDPSSPNHSRPQRVYSSRVVGSVLPSWERPRIDKSIFRGRNIVHNITPDETTTTLYDDDIPVSPPPGAATPGMEGRSFPLVRNEDGTVEVKWSTCPECGERYAIEIDHVRTRVHREAVARKETLESIAPIPAQPEPEKFERQPARLMFGETLLCPRCKGARRKKKGVLSEQSMDPYNPSQVCPRCDGTGVIPNKGPVP